MTDFTKKIITWKKRANCKACGREEYTTALHPVNGNCHWCDLERIEALVPMPIEREGVHELASAVFQDSALQAIGSETIMLYAMDEDGELHPIERQDADMYETIYDRDGNITEKPELSASLQNKIVGHDLGTKSMKSKELEAQADEILRRDAILQDALANNPDLAKQMAFDHLRSQHGLPVRNVHAEFKTLTAGQFSALKKIGWSTDELNPLRLSISDASRLMQQGPRWLKR